MRLSPALFNRHLRALSQAVTWRRAYPCPCRAQASGGARQDCAHCHGVGVLWGPGAAAHTALSGQKTQREWANFGQWESGDVVLSIPADSPLYDIGAQDRVLMTDGSVPYSAVRTRRAIDRLPSPVAALDRVFWYDAEHTLIEGAIPPVTDDGRIAWPAQGAPAIGQQYSVRGRRRPEYFCWGPFPQERAHHGGQPLPRRVVLRSFDLYRRGVA